MHRSRKAFKALTTSGDERRRCMHLIDSDLDSFCTWLCQREHEIVGRPGMVYHCPLAQWLSESSGHIYGVESRVYGLATCDYHCWRLEP
jgi:hypothetical protein